MEWKFAKHSEELGDSIGFKDNDIEKFSKNPTQSIVREAIQNSCDALDDKNGEAQVKVVIKSGKVSKDSLPNFKKIEEHIKCCLDEDNNDDAENIEIQRHLDAFENPEYSFIEIADYNTTGMDLKSFKSLTQAIFKSNKSHLGSQGSKGVGKAAYYASSYLRTMLVSSKNDEGLRYRGASKISTHKNPEKPTERLNYKGFYGDTEFKDNQDIPDLFRRSEKGTSVFIIGSWETNNFKEEVIKEILRNYWFAIAESQLIVNIEGEELNNQNIANYILNYFEDYKDYKTGDKQNPRPYFETYQKGSVYNGNIANIGECKLWLHKNEDFNLGAVARFRKTKMLIYKENNIDPGYAGIFLCDTPEGNAFLKDIENDAHDQWNPKLNPNKKEKAIETINEIKEFIRKKYFEFSGVGNSDSFEIDILDELFSFSKTKEGKKKVPEPKPTPATDPEDSGSDRVISKQKFIAHKKENKLLYKLTFNARKSRIGQQFKISIGTDSSKDKINIKNIPNAQFKNNTFIIDITKGVNTLEEIELNSPYLVAPSIISIN